MFMSEELKNYEISFLLNSENTYQELIQALKNCQFSIIDEGSISKIKLAYPTKKENFAYFGCLRFSGHPHDVKNLNSQLKTNPKILRFLIIHQSIISAGGGPALSGKESERGSNGQSSLTQAKRLSERQKIQGALSQEAERISKPRVLSNEALEKKLEEILK